jgi:hypothetical protein
MWAADTPSALAALATEQYSACPCQSSTRHLRPAGWLSAILTHKLPVRPF